MSPSQRIAIFAAGFAASVVNAVAGGGTLISFPVLLWAGRDPVIANATNTLALLPGSLAGAFGFRREIAQVRPLLLLLLPAAVVGGLGGGALLLHTPSSMFGALVPYLILLATMLLAFQGPLARLLRLEGDRPPTPSRSAGLLLSQLLVSIYGGYFGAGMGIIMLAALGLYGVSDIHQRNGLKNLLAAVINGVAGIYFIGSQAVNWEDFGTLVLGTVAGGYVGAMAGRRLDRRVVQVVVIAIGVTTTALLLFRQRG